MTELQLKESTRKFIDLNHFASLTKVQKATLEATGKDRDLVIISKTGTGKTHAYLLAIMEKIDPADDTTQVIVSLPTRELASQIYQNARMMKKVLPDLRLQLLSGGKDSMRMREKLKQRPQMVIGTLGRIKELFLEGILRVDTVKIFVIDEADMTLEYGFLNDIDIFFSRMKNAAVWSFSATLPEGLKPFIRKYLTHPLTITVGEDEKFDPRIEHLLINCKHRSYGETALSILKGFDPYVCLIFANSRRECEEVQHLFRENDISSLVLHGGLSSRERQRNLKMLKDKAVTYVIATDVAARGLDVDGISHVISLGFPEDLTYYIHRSGRTGRSGKTGTCFALYQEKDIPAISKLKEQGVHFKTVRFQDGTFKEVKERVFRPSNKAAREKELVKRLTPKKEKVKPNYKKKKNQKVAAIQRKEHSAMIKKQIREAKKERYRKSALQGR